MALNNICSLKNREKNKRIFILANGTSILKHNLAMINDGDVIIGMNSSTKLEKEHGFISDYYVVSDTRFINNPEKRECATSLLDSKTIRVFRSELLKFDDVCYINDTFYIQAIARDGFSNDLSQGFYFGCTTTMLAIQLAYYLGASEIYLLGVDLNYLNGSVRFYDEKCIEFADPFISVQIHNLLIAREYLLNKNIGLYNCSPNSFIRPYLGYISFDELF